MLKDGYMQDMKVNSFRERQACNEMKYIPRNGVNLDYVSADTGVDGVLIIVIIHLSTFITTCSSLEYLLTTA